MLPSKQIMTQKPRDLGSQWMNRNHYTENSIWDGPSDKNRQLTLRP